MPSLALPKLFIIQAFSEHYSSVLVVQSESKFLGELTDFPPHYSVPQHCVRTQLMLLIKFTFIVHFSPFLSQVHNERTKRSFIFLLRGGLASELCNTDLSKGEFSFNQSAQGNFFRMPMCHLLANLMMMKKIKGRACVTCRYTGDLPRNCSLPYEACTCVCTHCVLCEHMINERCELCL